MRMRSDPDTTQGKAPGALRMHLLLEASILRSSAQWPGTASHRFARIVLNMHADAELQMLG
jgi:hypothetical protein